MTAILRLLEIQERRASAFLRPVYSKEYPYGAGSFWYRPDGAVKAYPCYNYAPSQAAAPYEILLGDSGDLFGPKFAVW
jgi:hypothetical protein